MRGREEEKCFVLFLGQKDCLSFSACLQLLRHPILSLWLLSLFVHGWLASVHCIVSRAGQSFRPIVPSPLFNIRIACKNEQRA